MAGRNIRGITVEIGGDTSGLQKALSDINGKIKSTQAQLKDVDRLLKLDPTNTVLVAQKQELLRNAIAQTGEKLESLEAAQEDVNAAMEAGKIGREQYMAFQREVEETRAAMNRYKAELDGMDAAQEQLASNVNRLNRLFELTGTNVDDYADVLGSRLVAAIKNGSATSDQLRTAIERVGRSAVGGRADIQQLNEALDAVDDGQALRNLQHELEETGNHADSTAGNLESMGQTLTGGVLMEAADQLSVVGDKIAELGDKAMDAFTETQDATVKASAYFGETGAAAEQTAGIIQDVYAEGVGDSMDAVSDAVITVKKNIKDLDETELTHLTEQAITLDELYGIDMNETLRGVNALMQQYGMTAQEAMDYIVKGTQNGLDKTNELGDNLSEYSGKFAQAGYSAQEYFQLLQNGLEGGAYNLEKVNDAINEVTTRLADGTIADSMSQINEKTGKLEAGTGGWGQEVEDVFRQWQQGGATQKQVIDAIVADIRNTESQQDKLNKAALAFGTMAEDGNAKFIESLTSVGNAYDEVSGSAEGMFDSSTTESQKFEASLRLLEQSLVPLGESIMSLANEIIPPLAKGIQAVGEFFGNLPEPVQNFVVILGALITAFTALAPVIAAVVTVVTTLGVATLGPIIGIIAGVAAAVTAIIAVIKNWGSVTEWFGDLWQAVKEKCSAIWNDICAFFTETIPAAWDSLTAKFEGIPAWWSGIWQQVGDFFEGIWTSICGFFTETIPAAWQSVVAWFEGIPAWWTGVWQQVGDFFEGIWSGICGFFTETIPAAWQSVVAWFEGIPAWWSGIWQPVHDFFINIWSTISQNPVISTIVTTIIALWNNAVTTLQNIWENMKTIAGAAWELMKNVILGPVLLLIDLVTGDFEQLKDDTQNIWENIKNAAVTIWTALKDLVSNVVKGWTEHMVTLSTGLKDTLRNIWEMTKQAAVQTWENIKSFVVNTAQNLKESVIQAVTNLKTSIAQAWENIKSTTSHTWENIKSFVVNTAQNLKESAIQAVTNLKTSIAQAWENIKSTTSRTWENIKSFVVNTVQNLKESATQAFRSMVDGIRNALSNLGTVVSNGFQSAINFITSLPGKALQWGADFINGIARGIRNAIGNVTSAVSDVASKIRSFLHFSVPDEGPLTEYESWMPDFMKGLAKGIEKSKALVTNAIAGVSKDMTINANAMVEQSGASQNSAILNIATILSRYLPYLEQGSMIVLDTGSLVGEMAPAMSRKLGEIEAEEYRL